MKRRSVAPREAEVLETIAQKDIIVFGPRDLSRFLGISRRNAYRILGNMHEKRLVRRLGQGRYVTDEAYNTLDSYEIISHLEPASYIGFWSALWFHDLTEQVPRTAFVAVTRQKRSISVQGQPVRFVRLKPDAFFGYEQYGRVVASNPEKTIVDCLRHPEYAGGIQQVNNAISPALDLERLIRYTKRLGSGAVAARVGYLLMQQDFDLDLAPLSTMPSSYTKLDPTGNELNPNATWKLYINVNLDD